jgi:hypothetical protein
VKIVNGARVAAWAAATGMAGTSPSVAPLTDGSYEAASPSSAPGGRTGNAPSCRCGRSSPPPVNLNREFDLAANFLVAVADMALGQGVRASVDPNLHLVTAGLTVDFARPVRVGDWVQAQADIQHRSRRTVFASCYLVSDGHRVVRASGIYSIVSE